MSLSANRPARLLTTTVALLGLAGCFGEGDGPERIPGTPQPTLTGVLVDSPVSGVDYTTSAGTSGTTNAQGEFEYLDGNSVTFSIGDILLGTVAGAPIVTPVELTRSADPNDPPATNMLVFLQSLDADADPSNGITITTDTIGRAAGQTLNFENADFAAQVAAVVADITEPDAQIVSESQALINFYDTYVAMGGTDTFSFPFAGFPPVGGDVSFELIFADEFNVDGAPDATKWGYDLGYGPNNFGWGNNEWQLYTDSADNVRVEDGNLVIQARCDTPPCGVRDGTITSARINTKDKFEFKFGKVVARIKPPVGDGAWPAFWSLGANFPETPWPRAGEIDFMEMHNAFSNERTTHFTMHWCDQSVQDPCSFPDGWIFDSQSREFPTSLGDDFHIFEADWDGSRIIGSLDGVQVFSREIEAATMEEFLREFFLILNVAMGGTLGSNNEAPNGNEVWPQTMLVDYVRVFQRMGDGVVEDTVVDFEDAPESYDFGMDGGFGGGAAAVVANPVSEGINTSAQVGRMLKFPGEVFGGSLLTLPEPVELAGGGTFTMKVWSPREVMVLFKLEGGATTPEINVAHGGTGWEELSFNFDNFNGEFTGISLIFDLGTVGDATADPDNWTFYFDDILIPTGNGGGGTDPDPDPDVEAFSTDFEGAADSYSFGLDGGFGGGAAAIVTNPVPEGINTSGQVGRMLKFAGEVFAGSRFELPSPIAVESGSSFTMKVWSPREVMVLFKLEGGDTEPEVNVAHGGTGWEELTFDFGTFAGTVEGITLIFDLGIVGDAGNDPDNWTFYFDDITQVPPQPTDPGSDLMQIDLPITFDDAMVDYTVVDFGGAVTTLVADPTDATNMVASSIKPLGSETFAGTTMNTATGLATAIPFTATETTIGVRVYSPDAGIPVRLKAEDLANGNISVEAEAMTTVANEWETLVFDFSDVVEGPALDITQAYRKLSVFFNFGTTGDVAGAKTYLWDDVEFGVLAPVVDETPPTLTSLVIASNNADPTIATTGDDITLTLTADEPIAEPTVTIGGVAAAVTGAGTTWVATRTLDGTDADGVVAYSVAFSDLAGNAGTPVTATTDASAVALDGTAPTVVISGAPVDFDSLDPIALTVTFSEAVTGVALTDIVITNGAASALVAVDATTYTVNATPNGAGDLIVAVNAGAGIDAAGNLSDAATAVTITNVLDADAPLLTAVTIASSNANPAFARTGDVVTISMTASEDILAPLVAIAGQPADMVTGADATWTASRTMLATDAEGPVAFVISFEDLGGNAGPQSSVTTNDSSVTFDITAPTLTFVDVPATVQTLDSFTATFTFSEDVTGFEAGDIAVTNGAAATFTAIDEANYTAIITPDGLGDLVVTVAADSAIDSAGNSSTATTATAPLDLQPIWQLVWSDEFDGGALDAANWTARDDSNCPDPCTGEQTYDAGNVIVAAGMMTVEGREAGGAYTSGLIDSRGKREFTHGRVEIDARMPGTLGTRPSLYLLPVTDTYGPWPQSGEIDVANAPDLTINGNASIEHTLQYGLPVPENTATTVTADPASAPNANTLTYALEWEAGELRWFVDDVHVATQTQDNWYAVTEDDDGILTLGTGAAPFDQNFYLAIGMSIADTAGVGSTFPQSLQVDAVRFYECANAIDPVAGSGCSTADPGITAVTAPSEPYSEQLDLYVDAPTTVDFIDASNPGTPVSATLAAITTDDDSGFTSATQTVSATDGTDTFWSATISADFGTAGIAIASQNGGIFDFSGSENAGELLFRMRVNSASGTPQLRVGLASGGGGRGIETLDINADGQWRQYSVKVADLVTQSVADGTTLNVGSLINPFLLDVRLGSMTVDVDDITLISTCRDDNGCEATPRLPSATTIYEQDFEAIDNTAASIGDGWRFFVNVFDNGTFLFGYPGAAPNGPQISAIATGEGGMEQGTQQLSVYSDYECCAAGGPGGAESGHRSPTGLVETNVFQEPRGTGSAITADDVGDTWTFTYDAKRGNLSGNTTASAFIKVLNPADGFSTTVQDVQEMTTSPADWNSYSVQITIGAWEGQILQFGFQSNASNFEDANIFYDNVKVTVIDGQ